jgi:hypothetical protein
MVLSLTACADTRHALTVNGEEIRAGEYIYMQISAAQEAADRFSELNPDINVFSEGFDYFRQEIDGKSFGDWINDRAVGLLTEMAVVSQMFDELGLVLSATDELDARRGIENLWESADGLAMYGMDFEVWGEFYEEIGVGKESLISIVLSGLKEQMIFSAIFGAEGTEPANPQEVSGYFEENFVRFRVIVMSHDNLSTQEVDEIDAMSLDFADRLNAGESFLTVLYEYEDYVMMRDFSDQFIMQDESWMFDEDSVIYDYEDPMTFDDDFIDNGFIGDDHPAVPQDEQFIIEAVPQEEDIHVHDHTEDLNSFDELFALEELSEDIQEFLLSMTVGTAAVYVEPENTFVFQLLPLLEREDWLTAYFDFLVFELKEEVLQQRVSARTGDVDVVLNDAAIRRYKPETAARRLIQPWF